MKKIGGLMLLAAVLAGCQKSDVVSEFTGTETTYALQQSSQFNVSGTVIFKERKDGKVAAVIQLTGTEGMAKHPVHLHLGDIATPSADVALLMNPVLGSTGKSETVFNKLSDESAVDYKRLKGMQAFVTVHLGDIGPERDVILAAGNVGTAVALSSIGGRSAGVALCKSE